MRNLKIVFPEGSFNNYKFTIDEEEEEFEEEKKKLKKNSEEFED